jgi:hypothetical protein
MLAVDLIRSETHVILPNSCALDADPPLAASGPGREMAVARDENAE